MPANDPDTIPGGLMAVVAMRVTRPDSIGRLLSKPDSARQSIDIDFMKMAAYTNVSYHHVVSRIVMIGGEILFTPGLLGMARGVNAWGIGLDEKIFFQNRGLQGMHLSFSQNFYSIVFDAKGEHIVSMTFDFAHRYMAGRSLYLDTQLGAEYFINPLDLRPGEAVPPMFIAFEEEEKWAPHIVLRVGYLW